MDRNKGSRKKLNKRQILLIAAVALAAVLLLTGRLTPAGLINSLLGTDIPEAQQTYESVQPAETAEDLPPTEKNEPSEDAAEPEQTAIDEDGEYTSKEDVALYIHTYGKLPKNFIKKSEAKKLGWEGGSLAELDQISFFPAAALAATDSAITKACFRKRRGAGIRNAT